jgi:hypothetical protein
MAAIRGASPDRALAACVSATDIAGIDNPVFASGLQQYFSPSWMFHRRMSGGSAKLS